MIFILHFAKGFIFVIRNKHKLNPKQSITKQSINKRTRENIIKQLCFVTYQILLQKKKVTNIIID